MKKFCLDEKRVEIMNGISVSRIIALVDIPEIDVKAGDFGGYVEKEWNLSHYGNCWIFDEAIVRGDSRVMENATVRDSTIVAGIRGIIIKGNATVKGKTRVHDAALIEDNAVVSDAFIYGKAIIKNNASVFGGADVHGSAIIRDNASVFEEARVSGFAVIGGNAKIHKHAVFFEDQLVDGNTEIVSPRRI